MSQENVEVIMRAFEAARDDPEEFFGILGENVVWDVSGYVLPGFADTYYGRDGVREFFRTWIGPSPIGAMKQTKSSTRGTP
jgi:hypothetical protein